VLGVASPAARRQDEPKTSGELVSAGRTLLKAREEARTSRQRTKNNSEPGTFIVVARIQTKRTLFVTNMEVDTDTFLKEGKDLLAIFSFSGAYLQTAARDHAGIHKEK